jgi:hypothetical protein
MIPLNICNSNERMQPEPIIQFLKVNLAVSV